jgi:hypothetical protein
MSGDEAAWLELIARYELPAAASDTAAPPWPERENLQSSPRDPAAQVTGQAAAPDSGPVSDDEEPSRQPGAPGLGTGAPGLGTGAPGLATGAPGAGSGVPDAGTPGTGAGSTGAATPGTGATEADAAGGGGDAGPGMPAAGAPGTDAGGPGAASGPAGDRTRVVRHASAVPRPAAADDDEDEEDRYVPPPPPPLPKLDPVTKGAWAALFGGPAYLLVATLLSWQVSSWAALTAVAAFVGGFAVVILRMGDGPSRGDGPDNGAVI